MSVEIFSLIDDVVNSTSIKKCDILNIIQDCFIDGISEFYPGYSIICELNENTGRMDLYYKLAITGKNDFVSDRAHILREDIRRQDTVKDNFVLRKIDSSILRNNKKELINKKILNAIQREKRNIQCESLEKLGGSLISCFVIKVEESHILLNIHGMGIEAIMFRNAMLPGDNFQVGDRVLCSLYKIVRNTDGCPAVVSRRCYGFFAALAEKHIPEIREKLIEVVAIVGYKLCSEIRFAVRHVVPSANSPATECVGKGGMQLRKIKEELKIEKVTFCNSNPDPISFAINAFRPINVLQARYKDEDENVIEIVVPDSEVKAAIGSGGNNAKLISQLIQKNVEVKGASQKEQERQIALVNDVQDLKSYLSIDDSIAELLVSVNLNNVEAISKQEAYQVSLKIPGLGLEIAEELINRAKEFIENHQNELRNKMLALKVSTQIHDDIGISLKNCVKLGENGITCVKDISLMSVYQLMQICNLNKTEAENIIKNSISYLAYEGE